MGKTSQCVAILLLAMLIIPTTLLAQSSRAFSRGTRTDVQPNWSQYFKEKSGYVHKDSNNSIGIRRELNTTYPSNRLSEAEIREWQKLEGGLNGRFNFLFVFPATEFWQRQHQKK